MTGAKEYVDRTVREAEAIERGAKRTVVAAVDESDYSQDVFNFCSKNFNDLDTKVVFVYVVKQFDSLLSSTLPSTKRPSEGEEKKAQVEAWVTKAQEAKLEFSSEAHVLLGDVREQLVLFADKLKPDALIMGSHGTGVLRRALIGSVSNYCIQHCSCPVVVVRKPKEEPASAKKPINTFFKTVSMKFKRDKPEKEQTSPKGETAAEGAAQEADKAQATPEGQAAEGEAAGGGAEAAGAGAETATPAPTKEAAASGGSAEPAAVESSPPGQQQPGTAVEQPADEPAVSTPQPVAPVEGAPIVSSVA